MSCKRARELPLPAQNQKRKGAVMKYNLRLVAGLVAVTGLLGGGGVLARPIPPLPTKLPPPPPPLPKTVAECLAAGDTLFKQKRVSEAERYYREAVRLDPGSAQAHFRLGNALYNMRQLAESDTQMHEALRLAPANGDYQGGMGLSLMGRGKVADAEPYFREAARLLPKSPGAQANMGRCLAIQNKPADAQPFFEAALALEPQVGEHYNNVGRCLFLQKKLPDAEKMYREAVRLTPANPFFQKKSGRVAGGAKAAGRGGSCLPGSRSPCTTGTRLPSGCGYGLSDATQISRCRRLLPRGCPPCSAKPRHSGNAGWHTDGAKKVHPRPKRFSVRRPGWTKSRQASVSNLAAALLAQGKKDEARVEAQKAKDLGIANHPIYAPLGIMP